MMKKRIMVLALGAMAVFLSGQEAGAVMAAGPTASAQLDWSTFEMKGVDLTGAGAPMFTWGYQYDSANADVGSTYQSDWQSDWLTGVFAEATGSYAMAQTTEAVVTSYTALDSGETGSANSWTNRYGQLTVSGTGLLMAMVDYSWNIAINEGQQAHQSAVASCGITLAEENNGKNGSAYAGGYLPQQVWDAMEYEWTWSDVFTDMDSGKLVAALYVTDGMVVNFSAYTSTNVTTAPVPVPAAAWLLGSGLFGLLATQRRKGQV